MTSHNLDPDLGLPTLEGLGGGEAASQPYNGLKALMIAVLEDGIRSYLSSSHRISLEAEYWIHDARSLSPFSFVSVCAALGLDSEAARRALKRMRARDASVRLVLPRNRPNVRRTGRIRGVRRR